MQKVILVLIGVAAMIVFIIIILLVYRFIKRKTKFDKVVELQEDYQKEQVD